MFCNATVFLFLCDKLRVLLVKSLCVVAIAVPAEGPPWVKFCMCCVSVVSWSENSSLYSRTEMVTEAWQGQDDSELTGTALCYTAASRNIICPCCFSFFFFFFFGCKMFCLKHKQGFRKSLNGNKLYKLLLVRSPCFSKGNKCNYTFLLFVLYSGHMTRL